MLDGLALRMNLYDTWRHNRAAKRNRRGPYAEAAKLQNEQHTSPSYDPPHIGSRSFLARETTLCRSGPPCVIEQFLPTDSFVRFRTMPDDVRLRDG